MRLAKSMYAKFESSDGRAKLLTLSGVGLLTAALLLVLVVLPASAGEGGPSGAGVQPDEIPYGGGSGACTSSLGGLPSAAGFELHINNPADATYTSNGVQVRLSGISASNDKEFNFEFLTEGWGAYDVVVNGGSKNTHFDYDDTVGVGVLAEDTGLHAPTRGGSSNLYSLSHINICFDEIPEAPISGTVFFDDDVDGVFDGDEDPAVGFTVYVISGGTEVANGTTDLSGDYSITVPTGSDYLVCLGTMVDLVQTTPLSPLNCTGAAGLSVFDSGHAVASLGTGGSAGNDFGVRDEFCGEFFDESGGVFTEAKFEIFEGGNAEEPCQGKAGTVFIAGTGDVVGFPVVGPVSGSFAAYGRITKIFDDPTTVVPLQYAQDVSDDFEDVPYCALRLKEAEDGGQFDDLVPLGTYPSLVGVVDPESGDPAVSCLVKKVESLLSAAEGDDDDDVVQVNDVLIQGDPFYG